MAVVTEAIAKQRSSGKQFHLGVEDILTPAARAYLSEHHIEVIAQQQQSIEKTTYHTPFGVVLDEKPEHMTHLRGDMLVCKDHPRIALRGKIDSLEAQIILVQLKALQHDNQKLVEQLQEVIAFLRKLMRCEITGEEVGVFSLLGLDATSLREHSHHSSKYYGIQHFLPSYQYGELVALLNGLRTMTREVELVAYDAFKSMDQQIQRQDIIQAFNRLSSLFWIMMVQVRKENEQ